MLLKRSFTEKHDRLHQNAVVSMAVLCSEAVVLLLLRSSIHSVASWAFHTVPWFHYLIGNWRGKERLNNFQEKSHTKKAFILFPISMSSFKCNYFLHKKPLQTLKKTTKIIAEKLSCTTTVSSKYAQPNQGLATVHYKSSSGHYKSSFVGFLVRFCH